METTIEAYAPENLSRWELPPCYAGATWPEYYVAPVTRNRDSGILTQSNWDAQWKALSALVKDTPDGEEASPCIVSENHWAVGWVEWVAIHESNAEALKEADELAASLESHPVLDEDEHSNREWEVYAREWEDRFTRREFARMLREVFGLCDAAVDKLEDGDPGKLREAFEALIPSGEYFTPHGDGLSIRIDSAKRHIDRMEAGPARAWMGSLLRSLRKP